jgi:hypothetical protein
MSAKVEAVAQGFVRIRAEPPGKGPALWLCSDKTWRPGGATKIATAELGDPADADEADATAEVNGVVYPVNNTEVTEEDGQVVATIQGA